MHRVMLLTRFCKLLITVAIGLLSGEGARASGALMARRPWCHSALCGYPLPTVQWADIAVIAPLQSTTRCLHQSSHSRLLFIVSTLHCAYPGRDELTSVAACYIYPDGLPAHRRPPSSNKVQGEHLIWKSKNISNVIVIPLSTVDYTSLASVSTVDSGLTNIVHDRSKLSAAPSVCWRLVGCVHWSVNKLGVNARADT